MADSKFRFIYRRFDYDAPTKKWVLAPTMMIEVIAPNASVATTKAREQAQQSDTSIYTLVSMERV